MTTSVHRKATYGAYLSELKLFILLQKTQANTEENQISTGDRQRPKLLKYSTIDNSLTTLHKHRFWQVERPTPRQSSHIPSSHGNSTIV